MTYQPSRFEEMVRRAASEYPVPIGIAIAEPYHTEEHRRQLEAFFSQFGQVCMLPVPLQEVHIFSVAIPNSTTLELLIAAYALPENTGIRDSVVAVSAGRQTAVAASHPPLPHVPASEHPRPYA